MSQFVIQSGPWSQLQHDAKLIRSMVFIEEQNISEADEWDEQDAISLHFVVYAQDQPIATARLLENNSIGRVAVLQQYRGEGIGKLLMQQIIQVAKQQNRAFLQLSAQVYVTRFYENLGFQVQGEEYLDCEIPHIDMGLSLKND
ncbi:GNAT family N-acetyltransferase [Acinetobacter guillouiae]|uniref:GNAT family N-acetyltransferase n=1 Tax=Acinetobacter guillouiae TaxID=106649 RepID=UPI001AE52232|nr:GNAT family N-acetyltransferase [Acinetobacter guillouiae]MBP2546860.1 putative GNAT family N-acyltransferase [Acinetobacter guillouiae]